MPSTPPALCCPNHNCWAKGLNVRLKQAQPRGTVSRKVAFKARLQGAIQGATVVQRRKTPTPQHGRKAGRKAREGGGGNDGESGCAGFEFARGGGGPEKRCQSEDHTTEASSVAGSAECVNTTVSKQSQSLVKSNQGKSRQGRS